MSRAPPGAAARSEPRRNGRANAATISAIAPSRSASSNQSRMRRRCTDSYGILRRNISDGNSTTDFRSRCVRWISTGTASAARPSKNSGVRKPMPYLVLASRCRIDRKRNSAKSSGMVVLSSM